MNYPSSRYLTHDFVVWHGVTLKELLVIGVVGVSLTELIALVIGYCLGWVAISAGVGLLLGFILSARVFPVWISKKKHGTPPGHFRKRLVMGLSHVGLLQSPYLKYQGVWKKQRLIGEKRV